MNVEQAIDVLRQLVTTSLLVVSPVLIGAMAIGLAVSLVQAVTSIQEQTLSFVPKLVGIAIVIVVGAPWILRQLMQFMTSFILRMPEMVH